jgi:cytochrome c2
MNVWTAGLALLMTLPVMASAGAEDSDLVVGEKLYIEQCKICHGSVTAAEKGDRVPEPLRRAPVRLAAQQAAASTMVDIPLRMFSVSAAGASFSAEAGAADATLIAFAPPFGPNLRGVYGREAGIMQYEYSSAFLKTLKGMEWNDAALDVWITNPQAWVPGVFMFYKQPDAEIRRKIILYLKANP